MSDKPEERTPPPDWERIEAQYRAGAASLREIASRHGISEGAIRKRAKKEGWERDLSEKVRAKADSLVRKELVRTEVRKETPTEKEVVEVEAQVQSRIRLAHRKDISRARGLAIKLLDELEFQSDNMELLLQLGNEMRREDRNGQDKLNDLYHKLISLSGRTKTMKDLGDTLKTLIALEREAYGISTAEAPQDPLSALLSQVSRSALPIAKSLPDDDDA